MATKYSPKIVTDGLVLSLDAANNKSYPGSGTTWSDLSGNGNTGTLTNGPTFSNTNLGSIVFDGVDDYGTIDSKPERSTGIRLGPGNTPWMVNVLIRTTAAGSNVIGTFPILSNQSGGPVVSNMGLGAGGVMKYAHYNDNNVWVIETGTTVVNTGKWVFLSWVNLNNDTLDMYVNGVFDKNVSSDIAGSNVNAVDSIGYSWAGYLKADISNLTISTRSTLYTSTDVLQNYYQGNIVTNGLVLYLDAANLVSYPQSGTTWYDMSGNNNNATLSNSPVYLNNQQNAYFTFDGVDDYATIAYNSTTMSGWSSQQTICIWMYHNISSGRRNPWNQAYGGYGTWTHEQGGSINYYYGNAGTNAQPYTALSSATVTKNEWNCMCVTRDTTSVKWYRNGVLSASQSNPYGILSATTANVTIGNGYAGYWIGNISNVTAYNRALTASEIQQNFNAQRNRFRV